MEKCQGPQMEHPGQAPALASGNVPVKITRAVGDTVEDTVGDTVGDKARSMS